MKTIEVAGREYTVKGELPNGFFYLEGPRGGALLAKPVANVYTFHQARGGSAVYEGGHPFTATREQLAA